MIMALKPIAVIAAFAALVAGCLGPIATISKADEQAAPVSQSSACVASIVRPGGPDTASHAVTFAAPPLDTRYLISSGGYYQIAAVNGMTVTTVNAANRTATWLGGLIYAPNQMDKAAVEAIWPLEIGKTVTFVERAGEDAWCHIISIDRSETVNVPAGSFDTIVIVERIKSLRPEQGGLDVTRTYWYAPAAHWTVKKEIRQDAGPRFASEPYVLSQMVAAASRPPTVNSRWAKIDCGDAHIDLPFAQPHDCYHGPIGKGDDGTCHAEHYGTAGGDNTVAFEIYLSLAGGRCGIYFSGDDIQNFAQTATAMSRNGLDFSQLKRYGNAEVMSFTGKGLRGPLDCFAFARIGPTLHRSDKLYRYTLRGHVCKADGTKLSEAEIDQLARAISVD
jgi:hypothetical protein